MKKYTSICKLNREEKISSNYFFTSGVKKNMGRQEVPDDLN